MKRFYCANCGTEIEGDQQVFMFGDNYLQVKYFDDNKSNRFCSQECACEALSGEYVDKEGLPLDGDEDEEEDKEE